MTILVTGASGMIGSHVVRGLLDQGYSVLGLDQRESREAAHGYKHIVIDLSDAYAIENLFIDTTISRVIHLAALAHTAGERDLSWGKYYQVNVVNANNVFQPAADRKIPILFASTADVYGIVDGIATAHTLLHPIGFYAKSKAEAEGELKKVCSSADSLHAVFRFAPVYTQEIKRDVQKRYYLKYPKLAYLVGKGAEYEVLDIRTAVSAVTAWVENPSPGVKNIKNDNLLNTCDCIQQERQAGRANIVLHFPQWMVRCGFTIAKALLGNEHPKVYLLNKVVHPLRTE